MRLQSVFAVDSVTGKSDKIWSNAAVTTNTVAAISLSVLLGGASGA